MRTTHNLLVQTVEGVLTEVHGMLNRMCSLAEQSIQII